MEKESIFRMEIKSPSATFGFVEALHNPTCEQFDHLIEALKGHADKLLDWWDRETAMRENGIANAPSGEIVDVQIFGGDQPNGTTTGAIKYRFKADRFRDVAAFTRYQAEYAPKWHYDPI